MTTNGLRMLDLDLVRTNLNTGMDFAPLIKRVVHKGSTFEQRVIVCFSLQTTDTNCQQSRTKFVGVQVSFDVSSVDDRRKTQK